MARLVRRTVSGVILLAVSLLGLVTTAAAAPGSGAGVLATPTCTDSVAYDGPHGQIWVPAASNGSVTCNMVRGNVSQPVAQLQFTMNECYPDQLRRVGVYPLDLDENFGGNTQKGLKAVQSFIGTTADGVYGPNTRNAMKFLEVEAWPIACKAFR